MRRHGGWYHFNNPRRKLRRILWYLITSRWPQIDFGHMAAIRVIEERQEEKPALPWRKMIEQARKRKKDA